MVEGIVDDVDRLLHCGPHDIGFIIGQNLNPAVAVKIVTNLADLTGNARLRQYLDNARTRCTVRASFIEGTQVLTATGLHPIESLEIGQLVATRQYQNDALQYELITKTHQRIAEDIHIISTSSGVITTTAEHPFYLHNQGWIEARDLLSGDVVATLHGTASVYSNQHHNNSTEVFNLTVDWGETYYVLPEGEGDIDQAVWVHNTCWDIGEINLPESTGRINGRATYEVEIDGETRTVYIGLDADGNRRIYDANDHPPESPRDLLGDPPEGHKWVVHSDGPHSIQPNGDLDGPRQQLNEDGNGFRDYADPFEGTNYTDQEYLDYIGSKNDKNEIPRSAEDYIAIRDHWRRGGEAHQRVVDDTVQGLTNSFPPPATVIETPTRIYSPDGCQYCLPDIMVINGNKVMFVEVKTGNADWTPNQESIYPSINDGTAVINNDLAQQLRIPPGTTIAEAFPGGFSVVTVYAPGYLD